MSATLRDDLRSFRRSWVHHTGMQLATLSVLTATFTVVLFVTSISFNLKKILASWGDSGQMTAYLADSANDESVRSLKAKLENLSGVGSVEFVAKEAATESFRVQMSSYAPDLLADADFANPFPASLKISLKKSIESEEDIGRLEKLAGAIRAIPGVEDVSWGQGWVRNYSSVVSAINTCGGVMMVILLCGSLFVIGNSIRTSIAARREEVAILELVGATNAMIRRPFITEGLFMGGVAATFAIVVNLAIFFWQKSVLANSLALARVAPLLSFLNPGLIFGFFVAGTLLGAVGAWLTVRKINDGWSASQAADV